MGSQKLARILYMLTVIALCLAVVFVPLSSPARAGETKTHTVNILFPTGTAPVTTTSGKWVDVTFDITGASYDYYIAAITIAENGNPDNVIGEYTQLIRTNRGSNTIARQVSLSPGIADGAYDVIVKADLADDFDPAISPSDTAEYAVVVGDIQGLSLGATLISKSLVIVGALLDQWVPSSNLNEFFVSGNASEALTDEGRDLVHNISEWIIEEVANAGDAVTNAGDMVNSTKSSVISEAPGIINGTLNMISNIMEFFSIKLPLYH